MAAGSSFQLSSDRTEFKNLEFKTRFLISSSKSSRTLVMSQEGDKGEKTREASQSFKKKIGSIQTKSDQTRVELVTSWRERFRKNDVCATSSIVIYTQAGKFFV